MNSHDRGAGRRVKGIEPLPPVNRELRYDPPSRGDKAYVMTRPLDAPLSDSFGSVSRFV